MMLIIITYLFSANIDKKTIYGIEFASASIVSFVLSVPFGETISTKFFTGFLKDEPTIVNNTFPYFIWAPLGASAGTHFGGNILLNQVGEKFDATHRTAFVGSTVGFFICGSISTIYSFIKKENPLNGFVVGAKIGCILGSSIAGVISHNK